MDIAITNIVVAGVDRIVFSFTCPGESDRSYGQCCDLSS